MSSDSGLFPEGAHTQKRQLWTTETNDGRDQSEPLWKRKRLGVQMFCLQHQSRLRLQLKSTQWQQTKLCFSRHLWNIFKLIFKMKRKEEINVAKEHRQQSVDIRAAALTTLTNDGEGSKPAGKSVSRVSNSTVVSGHGSEHMAATILITTPAKRQTRSDLSPPCRLLRVLCGYLCSRLWGLSNRTVLTVTNRAAHRAAASISGSHSFLTHQGSEEQSKTRGRSLTVHTIRTILISAKLRKLWLTDSSQTQRNILYMTELRLPVRWSDADNTCQRPNWREENVSVRF